MLVLDVREGIATVAVVGDFLLGEPLLLAKLGASILEPDLNGKRNNFSVI